MANGFTKYFAVNLQTGLVQHEGSHESCSLYARNSSDLFGAGPFAVVNTADLTEIQRKIKARKNGRQIWEMLTTD